MSRLSLFLPPFAGDYSGACSVLFPFDCMVVILDAGCCTRNYAEYDEPRWTRERKPAFSAQIRTLDTVMGDERGIVGRVLEAARELEPACIALVGTPVPAIVGMDLAGMASDIARECDIPCIGIATNGFDTYERGVSRALCALVDAFALPRAGMRGGHAGSGDEDCEVAPASSRRAGDMLRVNLLGATPLDYPDVSFVESGKTLLHAQGVDVVFDGMASFGPDDVAALTSGDANVVVSWGGLAAARRFASGAGIPFVAGVPFDERSARGIAERIRRLVDAEPPDAGSVSLDEASACSNPRILLVGDQVVMGSLRCALLGAEDSLSHEDVAVATFFSQDRALALAGDRVFAEDADLERCLRCDPDLLVVGDPLLRRLPSTKGRLVEMVHPAVSGWLFDEVKANRKGLLNEIRLRAGA